MMSVLVMLWIQYAYVKADWCSAEVDTLRLQLSEIHTEIIKNGQEK